MKRYHVLTLMILLVALTGLAGAAPQTPLASKGGTVYTVEDFNVYWLRNLGKDGLLDFLQTMVVYEEGLKQGLKPTAQQVEDFIDTKMGRETYDDFTELYSENAVRQLVEYTLVAVEYENWLREKVKRDKNVTVTEEEAERFFLNNIDQFHKAEGVYLSLILVDNQTQAEAALERVSNGEDFQQVASEINTDPELRSYRGELGLYRRGDGFPPALEEAAFALEEGQHSDIIKINNYNILYCHKRYPEVAPEFDEIKDDLMLDMVEMKLEPHYVEALNELLDRELPKFDIKASLFRPAEE